MTLWFHVYMHFLKTRPEWLTHLLSLSFCRLWFTWKTLTSAHTPSAEIWFQLRLHNVREQEMRGGSTNLFILCKVYLVSVPHY